MADSVEMQSAKHQQTDTNELANEIEEQIKLNAETGKESAAEPAAKRHFKKSFSRDSLDEDNRNNNNTMIKILVGLLITYSVIVSTIALIIALNASSSSSSCDCSLNGLAKESELTATNGVGDSGFCEIIDFCVDIKATNNPTMSPSKYPTMYPSVDPTNNPSFDPSKYPTMYPSQNPSSYPTKEPTTEPTSEPTMYPSVDPTNNPSFGPSNYPTMYPSQNPSKEPTTEPTSEPTKEPTIEPTSNPTIEPTIEPTLEPSKSPTYFDGYFIGDFKFSLKSSDHAFWRLCDGKRYKIDGAYSVLFEEIGFMFGSYNDTINNVTYQYFQIPNVSDSVVGVAGNNHEIGDEIGDESKALTNTELPNHWHYTLSTAWSYSTDRGTRTAGNTRYYGSNNGQGPSAAANTYDSFMYGVHCSYCANWATTNKVGSGESFSLMQPTKFIGNLFIYSGVSI